MGKVDVDLLEWFVMQNKKLGWSCQSGQLMLTGLRRWVGREDLGNRSRPERQRNSIM